jgi:flavorubredoxin
MGPGLTFNQLLIDADEPLLFHTGFRHMFPAVSAAVARIVPLGRLRWVSFSHLEADESGAMNESLAVAPNAEIVHGQIGGLISLNDMADRAPRILADNEVLELGAGRRVRLLATPHVPHSWDAIMLFEESSRTLFSSDLFTQFGPTPVSTDDDILGPAIAAETAFPSAAITPLAIPTMRRFGDLNARTLALMHGPAYKGDCTAAFDALARDYQHRFETMVAALT